MPGRRRRAQLRYQWSHSPRSFLSGNVDSARGRGRRRGARGGTFSSFRLQSPLAISQIPFRPRGLPGAEYSQSDIERRLHAAGAKFEILDDPSLIERSAQALEEGKALGWFQGRMEFGPRALGGRSILADPRSPQMQSILNLKVKHRESFRPFAPSVLKEDAADWFDVSVESPYMLITAQAKNPAIPAVTHVDGSARVQTVDRETNPRFHALISAFKRRTGCPVIVNTSFNIRGEPIVESPEDAFRCFMGTEIDVLAMGNCFLLKETQDPALEKPYGSDSQSD